MKSFSASIARGIRLRLKTGYLKEEPVEYTFMKRYPPLAPDRTNGMRPLKPKNIPFLKLYDKVIDKHPLYVDERLYPAYWQHDTTPLAIAKRQYDLMQAGMPEQEALEKAKEYVEELEGKAFDEMDELITAARSMGATSSFATDEAVTAEIARWRERLASAAYPELSLADQGEIDYLVQSKILKWNPVQTEIRMKDPIFVQAFKELRSLIFPSIDGDYAVDDEDGMGGGLVAVPGPDKPIGRPTTNSFYYETYADFFQKLKQQPLTGRWSTNDREKLSKWVYETLAIKDALNRKLGIALQRYLDDLRDQFFPMVRYPEAANSFQLPSPERMRELLYANGVGYRTDGGKLFVRRFYKIPKLLFPAEAFSIACARKPDLTRRYLDNPFFLSLAMELEGVPAEHLDTILLRLRDQHEVEQTYRPGGLNSKGSFMDDIGGDASAAIDAVLGGEFDDPDEKFMELDEKNQFRGRSIAKPEDSKGYKQLSFIASLISNWRCVLDEMNTPGMESIVEQLCTESATANDLLSGVSGTPLEPIVHRLVNVVDEDAVSLVGAFLAKVNDVAIEGGDKKVELARQVYRRAFVHRIMELISAYNDLKDDPENSQFSFPMDQPFKLLDYTAAEELFVSGADPSKQQAPLAQREASFKQSLKQKLGPLFKHDPSVMEETTFLPRLVNKDDVPAEDWDKIVKKYYTPPKSQLAALREQWLSSMSSKSGTKWDRMQDMKSEAGLAFLQRQRLEVQLMVRGQLSVEFENKEGARRKREFKRRGVQNEVLAYPLEYLES